MTEDHAPSISDEVQRHLEALRGQAEEKFAIGYQQGRLAQAAEDRYYVDRVGELSRLLAEAEAEIKRLRGG